MRVWRVSVRCLECIWRVSGGCLEVSGGHLTVPGRCLERCLEGAWQVSGVCPGGVFSVSLLYLECVLTVPKRCMEGVWAQV